MSDSPLLIDDDRYARLRLIAWWDQEKLAKASVLVVGAGALGNEVLKNLALLGVGTVYVVDFDDIEKSNLTRSVLFRERDCGRHKAEVAAAAAAEMNPDTRVIPIHANVVTGIGLGLIASVDVVIGCLDNREARLWVNRMCWKTTTPWVDGGIQEINGVTKVFVPPDGACYECAMTDNDYRLINLRYSCPLLKREDILSGKVPTAPTISSIIAGLQTQEALKLLHDMPVTDGAALVFNGAVNSFYTTRFQHREDCLSHETYPEPVAVPLQAEMNSAADLFAAARQTLGDGVLELRLDRDLVTDVQCAACDRRVEIMRSMYEVGMDEAICSGCQQPMRPSLLHIVESDSDLASKKLGELGVPAYDIVRVGTNNNQEGYFLLAGDRAQVVQDEGDAA